MYKITNKQNKETNGEALIFGYDSWVSDSPLMRKIKPMSNLVR